ncbi:GTP-binding protein Di-Ras2-like [Bactrocera neohumeralis]|uniref:GTP-binding protein Di-Ras2-like n=1 Tax=Bactrocera neohumeralis TaxID=98809 RepID=UPI0021656CBF|nr:GTP-binding protein Di-Ras2-like [Bactrocera neohumeralis]
MCYMFRVDILDTSGDMQFPAMRRLSIATAHAFMLVYASTSASSFQCVKQCFEEIREQRADYQDIPIVIAGNKSDLANTHREVRLEEVTDWVYCELPRLRKSRESVHVDEHTSFGTKATWAAAN